MKRLMRHTIIFQPNRIGCDIMALELSYETDYGITLESAYAKITNVTFDNGQNDEGVVVNYQVKIYVSESTKEEDKPPLTGFDFSTPLNVSNAKTQYNILKQGYLHLKTMDGFTDAIDS